MTQAAAGSGAGRPNRRILYLSKHFGYPLGGVRIAYHHVQMLCRNGFDARILLIDSGREAHFADTVPTEQLNRDFVPLNSDLCVIPEPWDHWISHFRRFPARKYVFCQNHFYLFHGLSRWRSYEEAGIDTVFCCSEVISHFLTTYMKQARAPVIPNAIDHALFQPREKRRQIACMPRKMKIEARFLCGLFRARHPTLADVPWIEIADKGEHEVAEILGHSAIFLALGRLEGFGLPPIEAMASGCLTVGFTGDGGRSFATPENGLWCDPEDWVGCVDAVAAALREFDRDGGKERVAAGLATAGHYTFERMERELVAFWQSEIAR